jgi:hypothetical protein
VRKAAYGIAKPFDPGPEYLSFGGCTMNAEGLTAKVAAGRGKNKTIETVRVAAPFEVLGACRDPYGVA